jgi:hypothetical protein
MASGRQKTELQRGDNLSSQPPAAANHAERGERGDVADEQPYKHDEIWK